MEHKWNIWVDGGSDIWQKEAKDGKFFDELLMHAIAQVNKRQGRQRTKSFCSQEKVWVRLIQGVKNCSFSGDWGLNHQVCCYDPYICLNELWTVCLYFDSNQPLPNRVNTFRKTTHPIDQYLLSSLRSTYLRGKACLGTVIWNTVFPAHTLPPGLCSKLSNNCLISDPYCWALRTDYATDYIKEKAAILTDSPLSFILLSETMGAAKILSTTRQSI